MFLYKICIQLYLDMKKIYYLRNLIHVNETLNDKSLDNFMVLYLLSYTTKILDELNLTLCGVV